MKENGIIHSRVNLTTQMLSPTTLPHTIDYVTKCTAHFTEKIDNVVKECIYIYYTVQNKSCFYVYHPYVTTNDSIDERYQLDATIYLLL